jgi:hypothetical protein
LKRDVDEAELRLESALHAWHDAAEALESASARM